MTRSLKSRTPNNDEACERNGDQDDAILLTEEFAEKCMVLLLLGFRVELRKNIFIFDR